MRTSAWTRRVGLLLLFGIALGTASCNWFGATGRKGDCTGGNIADDKTHTSYFDQLTPAMANAQLWAQEYSIDNASSVDMPPPRDTRLSVTDLIARDAEYQTYCDIDWDKPKDNKVGLTTCAATNNASRCEQSIIRYDTSDTSSFSDRDRVSVACHETGHSLGLAHLNGDYMAGTWGCMQSSLGPVGNPTELSAHDVDHLDHDL